MRKQLIGAASALALGLTGAAFAQDPSQTTQPGPTGSVDSQVTPPPAAQSTSDQSSSQSSSGQSSSGQSSSSQAGKSQSGSRSASGSASGSMDRASAEKLMGKTVVGANNEEIGEVSDIVLDPQSGQARQLIISSGGFLGLGEKTVAVDFDEAQINQSSDNIRIQSLTQQQVQAMQEFEYDDSTVSLNRKSGDTAGTGSMGTGSTSTGGSDSAGTGRTESHGSSMGTTSSTGSTGGSGTTGSGQ